MGSRPKVQKQDPEGDAQRAKDKATAEANREAALKRGGARTALSSDQSQQTQQQGAIGGFLSKNSTVSSLYSQVNGKKQLGG